jgi:hypothetical protein
MNRRLKTRLWRLRKTCRRFNRLLASPANFSAYMWCWNHPKWLWTWPKKFHTAHRHGAKGHIRSRRRWTEPVRCFVVAKNIAHHPAINHNYDRIITDDYCPPMR